MTDPASAGVVVLRYKVYIFIYVNSGLMKINTCPATVGAKTDPLRNKEIRLCVKY